MADLPRGFCTAEDKIIILGSVKFLSHASHVLQERSLYHKKVADIVVGP